MNEQDAEIVATCETAVTHLTEVGWEQGMYVGDGDVSGEVEGQYVVDYTNATACLGGALALASKGTVYVDDDIYWSDAIVTCPAIPAVAAIIREKHPDLVVDPSVADDANEAVIYTFNDDIAQEPEDVIEVLRETIKRHTSEVIEP